MDSEAANSFDREFTPPAQPYANAGAGIILQRQKPKYQDAIESKRVWKTIQHTGKSARTQKRNSLWEMHGTPF